MSIEHLVSAEDILNELKEMFYDVQPDEDYIESDEDLAQEISDINDTLADENASMHDKISAIIPFNEEWFPDGLEEDEQAEYRTLLTRARAYIEAETT